MIIKALQREDLAAVRVFTDSQIGAGYYSTFELEDILQRSEKNGVMCSLVLQNPDGQILGVRFSYPPGQWEHGKGMGLEPQKWPHPMAETAYFQSLFVSDSLRGQGWGGRLSRQALERLGEVGARGAVCHSWKESPHNSSTRYLLKLGFISIADYPLYWKDVHYNCTRCLKPPCQCTAVEMYLNLKRHS